MDYSIKLYDGQKIQVLKDKIMGIVVDAVVWSELDGLFFIKTVDRELSPAWWNVDKGKLLLDGVWESNSRNRLLKKFE